MTDKDALARARTDWAEDRTVLANERTFAAWIRTGMGAIVVALGLNVVFQHSEPIWLGKAAASIFLAMGIFIFWSARIRAGRTLVRLDQHGTVPQSRSSMTFIASLLTAGTLATGLILWSI